MITRKRTTKHHLFLQEDIILSFCKSFMLKRSWYVYFCRFLATLWELWPTVFSFAVTGRLKTTNNTKTFRDKLFWLWVHTVSTNVTAITKKLTKSIRALNITELKSNVTATRLSKHKFPRVWTVVIWGQIFFETIVIIYTTRGGVCAYMNCKILWKLSRSCVDDEVGQSDNDTIQISKISICSKQHNNYTLKHHIQKNVDATTTNNPNALVITARYLTLTKLDNSQKK